MIDAKNSNLSGKRAGWIAVLTAASLLFSLALACATPFAALASLAALRLQRRDAFALIGASWLVNQIVGFGFLDYPQTWDSFAWGAMIGIAALAATAMAYAAFSAGALARQTGRAVAAAAAFGCAFVSYEMVLYAATTFLPSGSSAFSAAVVLQILELNVIAFAGLLVLQRAGERAGLALPRAKLQTPQSI